MLLTVTDPDDPRLRDYRDLKDVDLRVRTEEPAGLYMAESMNVIARAVEAGHRFRSVLTAPKFLDDLGTILQRATGARDGGDVPVLVAEQSLLSQIVGYHLHRGAIAAMHRPALPDLAEILAPTGRPAARRIAVLEHLVDHTNVCGPKIPHPEPEPPSDVGQRSRVAVLEGLVDHTNVGACFRSAAAMGVDAVLVTPTCADPLYRRSIRVSMGTVFQVPWTRIPTWPSGIQQLKEAGYIIAGMTLGEGAITLDELVDEDHQNLALVFGTEGHGLSAQTEKVLDRRVTIPMMGGVDSLNVAASSAVAFYATR